MKKTLKPGETVQISGQYKQTGPRGGIGKTEVTLVKGKSAPPTPKPKQKLVLVDKTKHKK